MNLEERVAKLEQFIGDMDRISSVYANSLQEICDKYLSLLYIEKPSSETNKLMVDGWLGDIDLDKLPKNTIINVRASHTFKKPAEDSASMIVFKRDNSYVEVPLKKYDTQHPGNLVFLNDGDYIQGIVYDIYINSQNVAIISSSDTGNVALQLCATLDAGLKETNKTISNFSKTLSTEELGASRISTKTLTTDTITVSKPFSIPTNSTCSSPLNNNNVANKEYVDKSIEGAIQKYYREHHIFGTGDPDQALASAPDNSIFYRYK